MKLKSTLRVFNETELAPGPGVVKGQSQKQLAGDPNHPTERIIVRLASFEPGTHEHLHWHMIEVFYYVMLGKAVLKDVEGKTYEMGPGSVIYAPAGIAGAHSWEVTEPLRLLAVRATTDPERTIQFSVDPDTLESTLSFEHLEFRGAVNFKKSLY